MNANVIANVALRLLVGAVFIWAAAVKTFHPHTGEPQPPTMYTRWVRAGSGADAAISIAEMLLGMWIILGRFPRVAAVFCAAVLTFYTALLIMEMRRDVPLPCGCFWVIPGQPSPPQVRRQLMLGIARNALLIFSCAWIFFTASSRNRSAR